MWVSYVRGTPKMSQIGSLIYGITYLQSFPFGTHMQMTPGHQAKKCTHPTSSLPLKTRVQDKKQDYNPSTSTFRNL